MDQKDIQDLIKLINKSEISEFKLKEKDFSIVIRTNNYSKNNGTTVVTSAMPQMMAPSMHAPAMAAPAASSANLTSAPKAESNTEENAVIDESNLVVYKSPIVGTFYRKSAPDKPVFVKVDDKVTPGTVLCVIEAMKLFNEIECEISGTIVKVLVDDATPVEYDQPLFLINPA